MKKILCLLCVFVIAYVDCDEVGEGASIYDQNDLLNKDSHPMEYFSDDYLNNDDLLSFDDQKFMSLGGDTGDQLDESHDPADDVLSFNSEWENFLANSRKGFDNDDSLSYEDLIFSNENEAQKVDDEDDIFFNYPKEKKGKENIMDTHEKQFDIYDFLKKNSKNMNAKNSFGNDNKQNGALNSDSDYNEHFSYLKDGSNTFEEAPSDVISKDILDASYLSNSFTDADATQVNEDSNLLNYPHIIVYDNPISTLNHLFGSNDIKADNQNRNNFDFIPLSNVYGNTNDEHNDHDNFLKFLDKIKPSMTQLNIVEVNQNSVYNMPSGTRSVESLRQKMEKIYNLNRTSRNTENSPQGLYLLMGIILMGLGILLVVFVCKLRTTHNKIRANMTSLKYKPMPNEEV